MQPLNIASLLFCEMENLGLFEFEVWWSPLVVKSMCWFDLPFNTRQDCDGFRRIIVNIMSVADDGCATIRRG